MKASRKAAAKNPTPTLVGTWFNADEYATEVEFIVTALGDTLDVRTRDRQDGEEADIFEVVWDGNVLAFAAHWNSTGRFTRYRLTALSRNRVDVTYTYTNKEMYHRKRAKRASNPKM